MTGVQQLLLGLKEYGHSPRTEYDLDAKVVTLKVVLHLQEGDKNHRQLTPHAAVQRASALTGVPERTIYSWMEALRAGKVEREEPRGRPGGVRHCASLSVEQVRLLRL